jgi:uncharacterized protein YndB with AHSA1/START domain
MEPVIHSTFVIERSFPKPPETVFAAFSDPNKYRRWFAEGDNHNLDEFEIDFRVGGSEHQRYRLNETTPLPGATIVNDGIFQNIIPNQLIVIASGMTLDDKRISAALVTIELLPTTTGTDLICTHQGAFFEGADGPKMREGGWRLLFEKLAKELSN